MTSPSLRYETMGSGPAVVFIHGLGTTSDVWYSLRAVLAPDFHIITYDRSGCGLSPRSAGGFSIEAWVDELVDVLDRLGVDETAVIGHSLGSMVAQRFAARYPSRTRALVLVGGEAVLTSEARNVLAERVASIREFGLTAVVDAWLAGSLSEDTRAANPVLAGLLRAMFLANDDESYALQAETLRDADVAASDAHILCPTLLIVGDKDHVTPVGWQQEIAKAIPESRIQIVPNTAHMTMLEAPEAVNAEVLEFLTGVYR